MVILKIQPSLRASRSPSTSRAKAGSLRNAADCGVAPKSWANHGIESRFQRLIGSAIEFVGRCPRLQVILAPLALATYHVSLPIVIATSERLQDCGAGS